MNNLNLRQLEVLVAIVESGSFTEAASRLYLAQSTVSSHIRSLEHLLNVQLFKRENKKKLCLSDDGKRVYQIAQEIVSKCNLIESELECQAKRELVIGASTAPSQEMIPALVAKFMKENSNCICTVKYGNSNEIQQMLNDQTVQIGFVGTCDNMQSLTYECIAEDHLVLVSPNNRHYTQLKDRGMLGKNMLDEPFIFREANSATQRFAENYINSLDKTAGMNIRAYVSNTQTMLGLVERGTGLAIISYLTAKEMIDKGKLLYFELDETALCRNIYMARLRKGYTNELAKDFVSLVRQYKEKL